MSMRRHSLKSRIISATFTHSCASCKAGQDPQSIGFGGTLSQAHQLGAQAALPFSP